MCKIKLKFTAGLCFCVVGSQESIEQTGLVVTSRTSDWLQLSKQSEYCPVHQNGFNQSKVSVQPERVVRGARHHTHSLVLAHPLLKEVGLSLQRDVLHEVKGVLRPVDLHRTPQVS